MSVDKLESLGWKSNYDIMDMHNRLFDWYK